MARRSRIHFRNALYHVQLKSRPGERLFDSVADRRFWESLVEEGCERFGHQVHAFCWMKDRAYIGVQVADIPLSQVMQNLSFRYTRYMNTKKVKTGKPRSGPLFDGRYQAVVVEPALYLNELVRYIHNEPVRAGLSKSALDYQWTSHRDYMGDSARNWVTTEAVLANFPQQGKGSIRAFGRYVDEGRSEPERTDFLKGRRGSPVLGSDRFARSAVKAKPDRRPRISVARLARAICKDEGMPESRLKGDSRVRLVSEVRQLITCVALDLGIGTLTDMAERYNRDLTTMSRNQRHFRTRLTNEPELRKRVERYKRTAKALA